MMVMNELIEFLKKIPPFQLLDSSQLTAVAHHISLEFYPKGTTVLQQGGTPSEFLYIIKKGGVRIFRTTVDGQEVLIDYRGEGDLFGYLSLLSQDKSRANVITVEDTLCYRIDRSSLRTLLNTHECMRDFFLQSFLRIYIDKTFKEMHDKSIAASSSDRFMFTTTIEEIASKNVITAPDSISIREAAEIMCQNKISALVLNNAGGLPSGIVTDRDLRGKVVARGRDVNEPVRYIMSSPLIRADAGDLCFEAVLKMLRYNIHHLLVVKDGGLCGILTNHDLILLQGKSPLSVARDIDEQQHIEGLIEISRQVNGIIGMLLKEGARAGNIARILTEMNDRIVRKVLAIAERRFGQPPIRYCWICLGSEGRKEQTFKTDQDNAIIYADPQSAQENERALLYFSRFTSFARDSLVQCGFPACPADFMASNPKWCQPLKNWKKMFSSWINEPSADAVLNSVAFFDFRPVYGDLGLAEDLRNFLCLQLNDRKIFLGHIANMAIKNRPPIGFLKAFVVEKSGEHKDMLNIKIKGLAPLIDIVRLFALEKGVQETSTNNRINALKGQHALIDEFGDELAQAFEFLMLLRIQHQFLQVLQGKAPDNFINPNTLTNLEKKSAKEAFHLISRLQDLVIERYRHMIW
jgi:CBS domain-containing protein